MFVKNASFSAFVFF